MMAPLTRETKRCRTRMGQGRAGAAELAVRVPAGVRAPQVDGAAGAEASPRRCTKPGAAPCCSKACSTPRKPACCSSIPRPSTVRWPRRRAAATASSTAPGKGLVLLLCDFVKKLDTIDVFHY